MGLYIECDVKAVSVDHGTIFLRHCLIDSELVFIAGDDTNRGMKSTRFALIPLLFCFISMSRDRNLRSFMRSDLGLLVRQRDLRKVELGLQRKRENEAHHFVIRSVRCLLISRALNNFGNVASAATQASLYAKDCKMSKAQVNLIPTSSGIS